MKNPNPITLSKALLTLIVPVIALGCVSSRTTQDDRSPGTTANTTPLEYRVDLNDR